MSAYTFADISLIYGSATVAVMSAIVALTLLLRRRKAAPQKAWLTAMLADMATAEKYKGRLNPARLGIEKL